MNKPLTSPGRSHKLVVFAIAAIPLALLAWYVNVYVSGEELVNQENRIRNAIELNPWRSFIVGFGIYCGLALVPGTGGKAIVYGWLFGFWQALTLVSVGLTLVAMVTFSLSRYLIRDSIERHYASFLALMNMHLEKEGAFYLLTLRMAHAPYSIVNPVSGASRVKTWTFFWTTGIGLLPANAIWVYVGIRLPSLRELATTGAESFIDLPLIAALIACGSFPILVRWLVNHFGVLATVGQDHDATTPDH
ncbi:MAG: VTT domain-containing protein [Proteobacteria bacterium]|nr:VTT domain-containing protein [Pseudomonadota bacterium]